MNCNSYLQLFILIRLILITLSVTWFFACFFSYLVSYINNIDDKITLNTFYFRHNIDGESL